MTYKVGSIIYASSGTESEEFQADLDGADEPLGNDAIAEFDGFLPMVNNVYGVGSGDHGYGQTAISQADVNPGDPILSSQWTNLHDMIAVCGNHQGTDVTNLPPGSAFAVGAIVVAFPQDGTYAGFEADSDDGADAPLGSTGLAGGDVLTNYVWAIDTNRLNVSDTSLTVEAGAWTVTRGTSWTVSLTAEVSATWASEDAARYYFNSGGQIRLIGSQPTGTAQDTHWHNVLLSIGTIQFAAYQTANTGSLVGAQDVGYYSLTDSYKAIYTASDLGGTFGGNSSTDHVTISAKRLNYVGTNSGNGDGVQFKIVLTAVGTYGGLSTASGISFSFDNAKATTFLSGIASPTYATVTPF